MNAELLHLEELDRLFSGKMTSLEETAFRKKIESDTALKAEYELYNSLRSGIKTFHRNRLLKQFEKFELKHRNPDKASFLPSFTFRKLMAAASVTVVLAAGIFFWKQHAEKENNWQAYFINDPGLPVLMSSNNNAYNQAMNFYRQGDYKQALTSLPAQQTDTVTFYRGIFWLKLERTDSALHYLAPQKFSASSVFRQKAEYYNAMALWQNGMEKEAKTAFGKIAANTTHPFQDISSEILNENF